MSLSRQRLVAAACAFGLVFGVLGVEYMTRHKFRAAPEYSWDLKPHLSSLVNAGRIESYVQQTSDLYGKNELKE